MQKNRKNIVFLQPQNEIAELKKDIIKLMKFMCQLEKLLLFT